MIYLASPLTHPDKEVEADRAMKAIFATQKLTEIGVHVYSPIAFWYHLSMICNMGGGYETFQAHDEEMIALCDRFAILTLDGWEDSNGVSKEKRTAVICGRIIEGVMYTDVRVGAFRPYIIEV